MLTGIQKHKLRVTHTEKREAKAGRPVPPHCEVCGHALVRATTLRKYAPHFDHNHGTGAFRGWLCQGCNVALGMAGDNPEVLEALAQYLRARGHAATRQVLR